MRFLPTSFLPAPLRTNTAHGHPALTILSYRLPMNNPTPRLSSVPPHSPSRYASFQLASGISRGPSNLGGCWVLFENKSQQRLITARQPPQFQVTRGKRSTGGGERPGLLRRARPPRPQVAIYHLSAGFALPQRLRALGPKRVTGRVPSGYKSLRPENAKSKT